MILQALNEYYLRKRDLEDGALPARGFELKEIPFVIVLDEEGRFVDLEDTREGEGHENRARTFVVPQSEKRPGTLGWQKAFLLWDHPGYVLGYAGEGKDPEMAQRQHGAFIDRLERTFGLEPQDEGVRATLRFLKAGDFHKVYSHPHWEALAETGSNLSFRLSSERRLICERRAVKEAVEHSIAVENENMGQCLVRGEEEAVAIIHPAIKGVRGAQQSGANIVAFNKDAFESFGHKQGANAPVGERAAFAYTTAINHLLGRDSRQKIQVGDATTIFWAERPTLFEDLAADILGGGTQALDDPDRGIDHVRAMFSAPWQGYKPLREDKTRFYILGLAPNASRISIRFWTVSTVAELSERLLRHYDDMEIVRPPKFPRYPALYRLLVSTAVLGKAENIPPNLAGAFMQSILSGTRYPQTLLGAAVRRNRLEHDVTPDRAALIKAWLVRDARLSNSSTPEVGVSLDETNTNIGYRLGRLFAVLERTQEAAHQNLNRTIRESYYATASSSPVTVFPRLMRLKNHHLAKLENRGQAVNLEKLFGEIMGGIHDFPSVLDMADQGRFSIGYYHQRQNFFTKNPSTEGAAA